ncbi:hypothetical protein [uncultured Methanobrevibacter sp.]|uniref:hypothetical protein n=1 Tax=uncultured Methanobrevibacter sp. TaxID=253161 RepID=UPI00260A8180|nr:hypothetical protein [uncultured Methanobrevibacter sp.]
MSVENERNRDLFLKFCFMYFLNHILIVFGFDEKIVDMLPSEKISYKKTGKVKIFNNLFDFKALTESGKIIIFEFKKDVLRTKDLKQSFGYYLREFQNVSEDVRLILIVLSEGGRIREYTKCDLTFHPKIIKTKKINKQKDLNVIRNKFENNKRLTYQECSLLIALPLFDLNESEADIVGETCRYIKNKKHCIPEEKLDEVVIGSYLNIVEYIDESEQNQLMEMIGMAERVKGVLEMYKEELIEKNKIEIAKNLKGLHTPEEIAKITGLSLSTVLLL